MTTNLSLIKLAATERRDLGYITEQTRQALYESGMTPVEVATELNKYEENYRG